MIKIMTFFVITRQLLSKSGEFLCCYDDKTSIKMMLVKDNEDFSNEKCLAYKANIIEKWELGAIHELGSVLLQENDVYHEMFKEDEFKKLFELCEENKQNYAQKSLLGIKISNIEDLSKETDRRLKRANGFYEKNPLEQESNVSKRNSGLRSSFERTIQKIKNLQEGRYPRPNGAFGFYSENPLEEQPEERRTIRSVAFSGDKRAFI